MAGILKALLLLGALIVIAAILAAAASYFLYSKHRRRLAEDVRQAHAEGVQFGEETDDQGCLDEALARHKRNGGSARAMGHDLFLKGCLSASEQTDRFCDGIPNRRQATESADWQVRKCAAAGFDDPGCRRIFGQVQEYCESDLSRPERDRR